MKKPIAFAAGITTVIATTLTGCIVAPPRVYVPAAPVYVAPAYPVPAPGYVWAHHPRYGWGYRHSSYGWHRGWH
jgi:hypothetical protein